MCKEKVVHIDENGKVESRIVRGFNWCKSHKVAAGTIIAGLAAGGIFVYLMLTNETAAEAVSDAVEQTAEVVADTIPV